MQPEERNLVSAAVDTMHVDSSWLAEISAEDMRRSVDALYRVHKLISAMTGVDALLEAIMEESKQVAQAEACSLLLYDPERGDLYFHVALGERGNQQTLKETVRLQLGQGIAGTAALQRESIRVDDAHQDARFFPEADAKTQFETKSVLAIPLLAGSFSTQTAAETAGDASGAGHGELRADTRAESLIGVLEVLNKEGGNAFTLADMRLMEIFSSLAATAIVQAWLIEENLQRTRLAAIGQAVAGMSHYTKNLITGMTGSVDLIDQGFQQGRTDFLERSWPILKRSIKKISIFVEDMLSYSKARQPLRRPCRVSELVEDVSQIFRDLMSSRNVALETNVEAISEPVYADANGLHRCLLNLLTNAADAVPRMGGRIAIAARCEKDALVMEVSDNGPGVADDLKPTIFDPFFSTKGSYGTGLGLAVTRKIVREHGGDIAVLDAPGGGALFRLYIPEAVCGGKEQHEG